jgi:hypothetical protein
MLLRCAPSPPEEMVPTVYAEWLFAVFERWL